MQSTQRAAEAYKINRDGAASGVCAPIPPGLVSVVPKVFSIEFRLRAVAVLAELKNAERAAARLMEENPGLKVSAQSVRNWSEGLKLKIPAGRRAGHPGAPGKRAPRSPHRAAVVALLAEGKSQAEVARILGLDRQLVHYLSKT